MLNEVEAETPNGLTYLVTISELEKVGWPKFNFSLYSKKSFFSNFHRAVFKIFILKR